MSNETRDFLERLAGIVLGRCSYLYAWNIPVDTKRYASIMDPYRKTCDKIIHLCCDRGYITEDEAAVELMSLCESEA